MRSLNERLQLLESIILDILGRHATGLSEYQLIDELKLVGGSGFDDGVYDSDLAMFQNHFLLFHSLYRLRDRLISDGSAGVDIHCLNIKLTKIDSSTPLLPTAHDPLREYYLDLTQLEGTSAEDVDTLLENFWQRYVSHDNRAWALEVLGVEVTADYAEIKARYRCLVMEHHPDRGGDKLKLQVINEAMAHLKRLHS
ncbi:DNA-J related domain-containing protein [Pseudomonadota bacterium]